MDTCECRPVPVAEFVSLSQRGDSMSIRVFLADDHSIVRDSLSTLLNSVDDFTVVGGAANGREAVAEVQRLKPDVVLMDIAMPELNGIGATDQICGAGLETRVIILSVHFSIDHVSMALKTGARGYLLKRSESSEVIDAIRAVHAGDFYLSREITGAVIKEYILQGCARTESPVCKLTARDREILQMVAEGKSNAGIAEILGITKTSVEVYRSRLMKKLGIKDPASLLRLAVQSGLTTL